MDPTYELISEQVLSSDQSSVTFSNIPQGYDDLILLTSARLNASGFPAMLMRFNSDSGNKYSYRILEGSGSSVTSTSTSPASSMIVTNLGGTNTTTNTFNNAEIYIPSYTININKSISSTTVLENNSTTAYIDIISGLWSDTSAITSIQLFPSTASFTSNSSFYLYGIKNADDGGRGYFGPAMTGGDEVYTTGDGYKYHVFKNSNNLNVMSPGYAEVLVISGGGSGTTDVSGGGGAGGVVYESKYLNNNTYQVLVGAGGAASASAGSNGSNSQVTGLISSIGGGSGAGYTRAGSSGGSGGGGAANIYSGYSGVSGQGNTGGNGSTNNGGNGGGGGGAGGAGANAGNGAGNGGPGTNQFATWAPILKISSSGFIAGGGGGSARSNAQNNSALIGIGGSGGGGNGGWYTFGAATNGLSNSGSGGGGADFSGNGGNGGSGIVIIRYRI